VRVRTAGGAALRRRAASRGVAGSFVVALSLGLMAPAEVAGAATAVPLPSAVATTTASWVVLPMGQLSVQSNTFWQVLHAATPGSSHWTVVTPKGVADNSGLVVGASGGLTVVGTLPSGLLRFSPLSASADGGTQWNPVFLPGGLAARPDALAYGAGGSKSGLAVVGATVFTTGPFLSSWSPLVSLGRLRQVSPGCGGTTIDAVTVGQAGEPTVATGCRQGGRVAVFTDAAGSWTQVGTTLQGRWADSRTSMLRLQSTPSSLTALVEAGRSGRSALIGLWQGTTGRWIASSPLGLSRDASVLATSVGSTGAIVALVGSRSTPTAYDLVPGGKWTRLPAPPPGTLALGPMTPTDGFGGASLNAFTVHGTELGVYTLTPSGTRWVKAQTTQVSLAYGSSG
jgi:hypothetical protein